MKFSKKNQLSSELLVIDGMWGSGKSIITELISVFDCMECWNMYVPFDSIPILYQKKSIKTDAAITMVRNFFDEMTNSVSLSRSVNFRYGDLTSVLRHPKKYVYISRMFKRKQAVNSLLKRKSEDRVVIPIATHIALPDNDIFLQALGGRCKVIRCVRNPLFMLDHWAQYIDRCQEDPYDFTLKMSYKGEDLPFFAEGWEDEYLEVNSYEKSIKSISILTKSYNRNFDKMKKKYGNKSILEIPFELAVKNTDNVVSLLSKFVGQDVNKNRYRKVKKIQCLPRDTLNSGLGYMSMAWKNNKDIRSEQEAIEERLELVKSKVSGKYYDELIKMIDEYNERWLV